MAAPSRYYRLLQPLCSKPTQVYLGKEVHLVGLLSWILEQTGPAYVYVTTFSTSDDFLSGFLNIRNRGLVREAVLVADFKASRKTLSLGTLMRSSFDTVCFAENHSKLMLVVTDDVKVTVITSQNQTYGGRNESTLITTDYEVFRDIWTQFERLREHSVTFKQWITHKNS